MFEKHEKTPEFGPKDGPRPSLEAIMALQKMLEDGLLDQVAEAVETPALELQPSMDRADERAGNTRQAGAAQNTSWSVGRFFRDLVHKLFDRKRSIGGKSATGSG